MDLFAQLRDSLKARFPTTPVSVRRCKVPRKLCGDCSRKANFFLVRVDKDHPLQVQLDTLVHEFAHAVAYLEWENTEDHGPEFGMAYAVCYQVYEKIVSG
jgi:hypothetical protein